MDVDTSGRPSPPLLLRFLIESRRSGSTAAHGEALAVAMVAFALKVVLKKEVSGPRTRSGGNKKRSISDTYAHCYVRRNTVIGPLGQFQEGLKSVTSSLPVS